MDTDFKIALGKVYRQHRHDSGLTMQQLCLMTGVNRLTLRKIETGVGNPTIDILIKLAEGMGLPFAKLVVEAGAQCGIVIRTSSNKKDEYAFVIV